MQLVLAAHNYAGKKQRKDHHYLKGSVIPGRQCGSRLAVMNAKNRWGTVYPYFFCLGRQTKRTNCMQKVVLIEREEAVIAHYASVELSEQQRAEVRDFILERLAARRQEAEAEQQRQQRRIAPLTDERHKLLQAHYANAIPLDLLNKLA
ncbi:MAG: hypothetical protein ACRDJG_03645 [Actinomycetota bacterium]